jgi:hypothetical protein
VALKGPSYHNCVPFLWRIWRPCNGPFFLQFLFTVPIGMNCLSVSSPLLLIWVCHLPCKLSIYLIAHSAYSLWLRRWR